MSVSVGRPFAVGHLRLVVRTVWQRTAPTSIAARRQAFQIDIQACHVYSRPAVFKVNILQIIVSGKQKASHHENKPA
jgi:hypothetical protein